MKVVCKDKYYAPKQYLCRLTDELDEYRHNFALSRLIKNYIYDVRDVFDNTFAIRMPGRTYGGIMVDDDMKIVKCWIDEDQTGENKPYMDGVNEMLLKYIGEKLELQDNGCEGWEMAKIYYYVGCKNGTLRKFKSEFPVKRVPKGYKKLEEVSPLQYFFTICWEDEKLKIWQEDSYACK